MPFEIIQMGAVKLDNKFDVIDEFDRLVCPQVYPVLHSVCGEVTGITQEMLADGEHFVDTGFFRMVWTGLHFLHLGQYGPGGITA